MGPIRVLQMIGSLNMGGSQTMIMNLYRKIDKGQIQFDFILDHEDGNFFVEEARALGARIFHMPIYNGKNFLTVKKAWTNFFIEHPEYKILHSHVRSYASLYLPIAKKYGVRTIIHSHSTSNGKGIKSFFKKILQFPIRYQADYFFGCSVEAGNWLFGKKIVRSDKYFMLQNAIDVEEYKFNTEIREKYRKDLGLKTDDLTFIHVGRFHPAKNHPFLLELFAEIHKKNKKSKLLIVGDGELRNEIERKIVDLDIKADVILTGSRSDVPELLMAADCFLFPSNWEGLPVTVVEAQASGLPCLISDKVTRDVNVTSLVKYLPINSGVEPWVETVDSLNYERKNVLEFICDSGFDISTTAKWLVRFYEGI